MIHQLHRTPPAVARRGISVVELFGCIAALGGGILLGSLYLGVDVEAVAYKALEGEPENASVNSDGTTAPDATTDGLNPDQTADADQQLLDPEHSGSNSQSAAAFTTEDGAVADDAGQGASADHGNTESSIDGVATREYWDALTATLDREAAGRGARPADQKPWELFDYIAGRRAGHAEAVTKIEHLNAGGVDPRLLDFASRVEAWHRQGAELYARAAELLTDSGRSNLGGPVAQSWQSAATQHRMEERLLIERRQSLQQYLARQ